MQNYDLIKQETFRTNDLRPSNLISTFQLQISSSRLSTRSKTASDVSIQVPSFEYESEEITKSWWL